MNKTEGTISPSVSTNNCSKTNHAGQKRNFDQLETVPNVDCLSSEEFEVTFLDNSNQRFVIFLSDSYHKRLTSLKIDKKQLVEFSVIFLLQRLRLESIRHAFDIALICKHFPEYESDVKSYCDSLVKFRA